LLLFPDEVAAVEFGFLPAVSPIAYIFVDTPISHGTVSLPGLEAKRKVRRLEQNGEHAARYLTYSTCSSFMIRLFLVLIGRANSATHMQQM
jgi:hypothetical protein